jgi:predicted  nucleic acid-binding Zn-ribbon protein
VCQGCHEKLSAMERDKLKRGEGVKRCEYCRRILIISPSS